MILETDRGRICISIQHLRRLPWTDHPHRAPAIRRALRTRDAGCRFPGCTHQRYVDAHHIEHWADGGETKLSNLVSLCRLHHRLVHEGQIRIETPSSGGWRFVRPDGRHYELIRRTAPAYTGEELAHTHAELGIRIDRNTAATRWRGERMDYELGVWVLCQQAARARRIRDGVSSASNASHVSNVSAETPDTLAGTGGAAGAVDAAATLSSAPVE